MKYFEWNTEKNEKLKVERDVSFEDVVIAIDEKRVLDVVRHPNQKQYQKQKILIVEIDKYAYLVPFVESEEKIFFKTIIPSRKATEQYIISRKK